jgi:hypothetical protein
MGYSVRPHILPHVRTFYPMSAHFTPCPHILPHMGYYVRPHIYKQKKHILPHVRTFTLSAHLPHMGYSVRPHILPHFISLKWCRRNTPCPHIYPVHIGVCPHKYPTWGIPSVLTFYPMSAHLPRPHIYPVRTFTPCHVCTFTPCHVRTFTPCHVRTFTPCSYSVHVMSAHLPHAAIPCMSCPHIYPVSTFYILLHKQKHNKNMGCLV